MALLFGAFSTDFTSYWQCADTRSIGGEMFCLCWGARRLFWWMHGPCWLPSRLSRSHRQRQCWDKPGCCTPHPTACPAGCSSSIGEDFGGNFHQISLFHLRAALFFALFCQFATEAWMWSDCQSGLLHHKHRTIQFVVCGISWEAPEGNERRGYKYYRHLPQYGARWGDVTPPVPVRFLFLWVQKALQKALEKLCRRRRTESRGIAAGGPAKPLLPLGG